MNATTPGAGVDRFGAAASTLCAIHCGFSAFLPAALGALGVGFLMGHEAEWVFTLLAIAFAVMALLLGWRQHRSRLVAGLLIVGIVGLFASRFIEMSAGHHHGHHEEHHAAAAGEEAHHDEHEGEHGEAHEEHGDRDDHASHDEHASHDGSLHLAGTLVGVFAGMLLLSGHLLNLRATRRCRENQRS